MNMVDKLTAGDTLDFTTSAPDYPASAGWSLVYKMIPRTPGPAPVTLPSTASGDDHRVQAAATSTAGWTAGTYSWVCYATKGAERYTLEQGVTQVLADPGTASTLDTRSSARIALDNVTAVLEGRASSAVLEYEIRGRKLKYIGVVELIALKQHLKREVQGEVAAERAAAGLAPKTKLFVRI